MTADEAYKEIAKLASEHALIKMAAGGVIVIVHPDVQKENGIYELCQYMAGKGPYPKAELKKVRESRKLNR